MTTHVISSSGATVAAQAGDRIELHLPENPTTGFLWEVRVTPAGIRLLASELSLGQPLTPGAGGERTFTFVVDDIAADEGADTGADAGADARELQLVLRQPWDAAAPPERTFVVSVRAS
jgi:predicted secreted protein